MAVAELAESGPSAAEAVVVVGDAGPDAFDDLVRCLAALLAHTPADVPVVAPLDGRLRAWVDEAPAARERTLLAAPAGASLADRLAHVARCAPGAHVAHVAAATEVTAGWLERLRDALGADPTLASATATSNHAAFASVPQRNLPWPLPPDGRPLDEVAASAAGRAPVRPRLPAPAPHCVLLAGWALDLLAADGDLGDAAAVLDLGAQATLAGLRHVLADDCFVGHRGPAAPPDPARPWAPAGLAAVAGRHPWLGPAIDDAAQDRWSPLARALAGAARAVRGPSITVDARALTPGRTGTKSALAELVLALAADGTGGLRVVLPDDADAALLAELRAAGATTLPAAAVADGMARTDVVHRPWGVDDPADLVDTDRLGERLVLSQHDLIGYHDAGVFADADAWLAHRRVTRLGLAAAGAVIVPSAHVAADLVAEDLVAPERIHVVPHGTDDRGAQDAEPARRPTGLPAGDERPFLVAVGAHLRHKGLPFALDLLAALRDGHGWDGRLVLAGAEPAAGSSSAEEALRLARDPDLAARVTTLGTVPDAERRWLYEHAAAVAYPSTVEGFGLIPFEAAAAGTPCLWAPVASLADLLPADLALLVPWDAGASAARVAPPLTDPAVARAHLEATRAVAAGLTWSACAAATRAAHAAASDLPAPPAAALAARTAAVEHDHWTLHGKVTQPGWRLVDPEDGVLGRADQASVADALAPGPGRGVALTAVRGAAWLRRRAGR